MSYYDWASAEADMGADLVALARAAGSSGAEGTVIWSGGRFYVASVTQAALDAAMAAYDPADEHRCQLIAYAASKRWDAENGGTLVGGIPVATDDRSKIMIMGARVAAAANSDWETVWHGADGQTYPLNAAQMIAISDAVEAHVNATFATFASVKADIEAGKITKTAKIDSAFNAT